MKEEERNGDESTDRERQKERHVLKGTGRPGCMIPSAGTGKSVSIDQLIGECFVKSAIIVLSSRVPGWMSQSQARPPRRNSWFKLELPEIEATRPLLERWRLERGIGLPLVIEIHLNSCTKNVSKSTSEDDAFDSSERLAWNVDTSNAETSNPVLLERWIVNFRPTAVLPSEISTPSQISRFSMEGVYKRLMLLMRSLYTKCRMLPAYKTFRFCKENWCKACPVQISYKIHSTLPQKTTAYHTGRNNKPINLSLESGRLQRFEFSAVETCEGNLHVSVEYQATNALKVIGNAISKISNPLIIPNYLNQRSLVDDEKKENQSGKFSRKYSECLPNLQRMDSASFSSSPVSSTGTPRRRLWSSGMKISPSQSPSSGTSPILLGSLSPLSQSHIKHFKAKETKGKDKTTLMQNSGKFGTSARGKLDAFCEDSTFSCSSNADKPKNSTEVQENLDIALDTNCDQGHKISQPVSIPKSNLNCQRFQNLHETKSGNWGTSSNDLRVKCVTNISRASSAPSLSNSKYRRAGNQNSEMLRQRSETIQRQDFIVETSNLEDNFVGGELCEKNSVMEPNNEEKFNKMQNCDKEDIIYEDKLSFRCALNAPGLLFASDSETTPSQSSQSVSNLSFSPDLPFAVTPRSCFEKSNSRDYKDCDQDVEGNRDSKDMYRSGTMRVALSNQENVLDSLSSSSAIICRPSWGHSGGPSWTAESLPPSSSMGYSVSPMRDPFLDSIMLSSSPTLSFSPMMKNISRVSGSAFMTTRFLKGRETECMEVKECCDQDLKNTEYFAASKQRNLPLLTFPSEQTACDVANASSPIHTDTGRVTKEIEIESDDELFPLALGDSYERTDEEAVLAMMVPAVRESKIPMEGCIDHLEFSNEKEYLGSTNLTTPSTSHSIGFFVRMVKKSHLSNENAPIPLDAALARLENLGNFFEAHGFDPEGE